MDPTTIVIVIIVALVLVDAFSHFDIRAAHSVRGRRKL
jgi:hypothetical protein